MNLNAISIKNLLRRKTKAAFVLAGLVIGVSTVVGIISYIDAMTNDINHKLEKFGANILVVPKTENLALSYGGLSLGGVSFEMEDIRQSDLNRVSTIKNSANIAALGPVVLGVTKVKEHKVLLAGIDFNAARILKPWWRLQGSPPKADGVIAGAEAARVLNLDRGHQLTVNTVNLEVSGILEPTGSQDDQMIFSNLVTAQAIFDKQGQVSMVEVAALCKDCPIDAMVKQISDVLPGAKVMAIQQVVKGRMATLGQLKKFTYGISGVILLIGSMVVLITMMGSVRERTDEIGIFRAIGYRKTHIVRIVFLEALIISGLAGVLGYFLGYAGTKVGLTMLAGSRSAMVHFNIELAGAAILTALVVGLVSSAYPAFMAARLDPNDALRTL
jgi:putative ABC transport system permease protein